MASNGLVHGLNHLKVVEYMGRKLVVFDVDGTIIAGNTIPDSAVAAIRTLQGNGVATMFFTGRPYTHVDPRIREMDFDACVCTMGAYIRIGGEVVRDVRPPAGEARAVVEAVRAQGLDAAYESQEGVSFDMTRPIPPFLQGLKSHFDEIGFDTNLGVDREGFSFDKLCVWTNENSSFEGFDERISPYLDRIGKKENMEEWVAKGLSTVESVNLVMARLGIDRADSYAMGDSTNDLPMLNCTAHTIAMGQGPDALKTQVEFVTRPILEDGLAHALRHYGLI